MQLLILILNIGKKINPNFILKAINARTGYSGSFFTLKGDYNGSNWQ